METLTKMDAYRAMYEFLKNQNALFNGSEDLEFLLGAMQLVDCGNGERSSVDAAMWEDWEEAIEISKKNPDNANLRFVD